MQLSRVALLCSLILSSSLVEAGCSPRGSVAASALVETRSATFSSTSSGIFASTSTSTASTATGPTCTRPAVASPTFYIKATSTDTAINGYYLGASANTEDYQVGLVSCGNSTKYNIPIATLTLDSNGYARLASLPELLVCARYVTAYAASVAWCLESEITGSASSPAAVVFTEGDDGTLSCYLDGHSDYSVIQAWTGAIEASLFLYTSAYGVYTPFSMVKGFS